MNEHAAVHGGRSWQEEGRARRQQARAEAKRLLGDVALTSVRIKSCETLAGRPDEDVLCEEIKRCSRAVELLRGAGGDPFDLVSALSIRAMYRNLEWDTIAALSDYGEALSLLLPSSSSATTTRRVWTGTILTIKHEMAAVLWDAGQYDRAEAIFTEITEQCGWTAIAPAPSTSSSSSPSSASAAAAASSLWNNISGHVSEVWGFFAGAFEYLARGYLHRREYEQAEVHVRISFWLFENQAPKNVDRQVKVITLRALLGSVMEERGVPRVEIFRKLDRHPQAPLVQCCHSPFV